jgi:hypothetical protein
MESDLAKRAIESGLRRHFEDNAWPTEPYMMIVVSPWLNPEEHSDIILGWCQSNGGIRPIGIKIVETKESGDDIFIPLSHFQLKAMTDHGTKHWDRLMGKVTV